jgi:hypothetical protein
MVMGLLTTGYPREIYTAAQSVVAGDAEGLHEATRSGEDEQMHAERIALLRRQLFVAMSRARDGLWLGFIGAPSSLLPASLVDRSE